MTPESIQEICQYISSHPRNISIEYTAAHPTSSHKKLMVSIEALHLASQCLMKLDQVDECLALLEPLLDQDLDLSLQESQPLPDTSFSSVVETIHQNNHNGIDTLAGNSSLPHSYCILSECA